jgi:hypothetical protein
MIRTMTLLERAINVVSPTRAAAMARSRFMVNFAGQYAGARYDKTSLKTFRPAAGSADADSIGDLPTLRARSRDLARNTPIARGARNTAKTNVIGPGLKLRSKVDRGLLGLSEEEAEAWESRSKRCSHLGALEERRRRAPAQLLSDASPGVHERLGFRRYVCAAALQGGHVLPRPCAFR